MIYIITTGGTIEGLEYAHESENTEAAVSIDSLMPNVNAAFEYSLVSAFSKDSRFITTADRAVLQTKVLESKSDRILITHGTLTMIETAVYLGKLELDKTVVLVGAFILGTEKNTDAPFNLGFALCAVQSLEKGVYIAMNGKVFNWYNVKKNIAKNRFEEKMD